MDAQLTALLESTNPLDRKKAIQKLTALGGQESLRLLAGIYKYDVDPSIQELAIQAGKEIKKREMVATSEMPALFSARDTRENTVIESPLESNRPKTRDKLSTAERAAFAARQTHERAAVEHPAATSKPKLTTAERAAFSAREYHENAAVEDPIDDEKGFKRVFISDERREQAQRQLESAAELAESGSDILALDSLIKAFKNNPNYRLDSDAISVAKDVTGLDVDEFVDLLEDERHLRLVVKNLTAKGNKKKNKGKIKNSSVTLDANGDPTWGTIVLDLGLYFTIIMAIAIITIVLVAKIYQTAAATVTQGCPGCTAEEIVRLRDLVQQTKLAFGFTPIQGALYGLVWSFTSLIQIVVYYAILHTMVHMALSTEGTFRGMLYYCAKFDIVLYAILMGLLSVVFLLMLKDLYDPNYYSLYTKVSAPLWKSLWAIVPVVVFIGGLWSLRRVVTFYRVGCFQMGCVILISSSISSVILGGISSGVADKFFSSAIQALTK